MRSESQILNIRDILLKSCEKNRDKVAFQEKSEGRIVSHTYNQLSDDVNALGTRLLSMDLKGKHVAILGENSYKWVVSYMAVVNGVGVAVPVDKELPPESIAQLFQKGDVSVLIFSSTYMENISIILRECKKLELCICMDENEEGYMSIDSLIRGGSRLLRDGNREYIDAKIDNDKMSIIIFTSGTTGANKGVMLSHSNIVTVSKIATEYFKKFKFIMSVLPLHHIYENVCGMITPINMGATVFFNDSLKYLSPNMLKFRPDMSVMVPLFLETMYKKIWIDAKKMKLEKTLKKSIKVSNFLLKFNIDLRPLWFRRIHKIFGGRLKTIVCGGAFLRPELVQGYRDLGINVINGYGITECASLVSVNIGKNLRDNSIGKIVACNSVKISNQDEDGIGDIMVKGRNVMLGYYKDEKSTAKSFENGWFNTGDLGYIDENNNLFMTGRKKNLIVLDNGKNVHPEEIEGYILRHMPFVQEAIVYTSKNKSGSEMIVAAVYIDKNFFKQFDNYEIQQMIEEGLNEVNCHLPNFKKIHRIIIKDEEFKKNTSRKIIRDVFLKEVSKVGAES